MAYEYFNAFPNKLLNLTKYEIRIYNEDETMIFIPASEIEVRVERKKRELVGQLSDTEGISLPIPVYSSNCISKIVWPKLPDEVDAVIVTPEVAKFLASKEYSSSCTSSNEHGIDGTFSVYTVDIDCSNDMPSIEDEFILANGLCLYMP